MDGEPRPATQPRVEPIGLPVTADAIERLCRRFMAELDPGAGSASVAAAGRELAQLVLGQGRADVIAPPLPAPIFRAGALQAANVG